MRHIAKVIAAHKKCVVCEATVKRFEFDTCDNTCYRAKARGIDRGMQIELETRREAKQPYPEFNPEDVSGEVNGRQLLELEFDRQIASLFDSSLVMA